VRHCRALMSWTELVQEIALGLPVGPRPPFLLSVLPLFGSFHFYVIFLH
jgi:hypothetical protein